jgi:RNA polymerase sigma factor (sigma-70 family)
MCEKIENFDQETPSKYHPGEKATFHGWFCWQVKTVIRNYFRKNRNLTAAEEFKPELNTALADFAEAFYEEREQAIQTKAVELLIKSRTNDRTIEAFQMYLNGIGVIEIAEELNMPQNSVHQAICRCRKFLTERRKELEELI